MGKQTISASTTVPTVLLIIVSPPPFQRLPALQVLIPIKL